MLLTSLVAGDAVYDLWAKGLSALDAQLDKSPTCTRANLRVRKDWYVQMWSNGGDMRLRYD